MIKKILWSIIIIAILISIPSLVERVKVERANNTYETVIPYSHIEEMVNRGFEDPLRYERVLLELKEAGLQSIAVEPVTIEDLELNGVLGRTTREFLAVTYPHLEDQIPDAYGIYFEVLKEHSMLPKINEVFDRELQLISEQLQTNLSPEVEVRTIELDDHQYIFIPYRSMGVRLKSLGYDFDTIETLSELGFSVIPRVPNNFDIAGSIHGHSFTEELVKLREYSDKVLFLGNEVTGYPVPSYIKELSTLLKENDYKVLTIEFADQKGMATLLATEGLDADVVRLHSIRAGKGNENDKIHVEKVIRALNERNLKVIFFNPLIREPGAYQFYRDPIEAEAGLEGTKQFLTNVRDHSRNSLSLGQAEPFQELSLPIWQKLVVFLAGLAFTALLMMEVYRKLTIPAVAGLGLVMAAQIVTGHYLLLKAIVLFIALVGPIYAIVSIKESKLSGWKQVIIQFILSAAIAGVSAWFVASILYGTEYLVKVDAFTGVKVLAVVPVFIVALLSSWQLLKSMALKPVMYWQIPIFFIVAAALFFYVGRTGNEGIALSFELEFRQWLEDTLVVRPRTTQFLVGFPLFVVGLYFTKMKKKWAPALYIFGALAYSQMVGTFTHLHTPLIASSIRTIYGLVIGLVIGLMLVGIIYFFEKKLLPLLKERLL